MSSNYYYYYYYYYYYFIIIIIIIIIINFCFRARQHLRSLAPVMKDLYDYDGQWGAKVDWDFRISHLVKNPDGTDISPLW